VTISIGVAEGKPETFYEDVFKTADAALYKAKESGRNCICYEE
jgi:PleD family two-component response regulator